MNPENNAVAVHKRMKVYYGEYHEAGRCLEPLIRLRGMYLRQHGFQVGAAITVVISNGEITIKKVAEILP